MRDQLDIFNDKTIKNIKGYINSPRFTLKSILFFEKHFKRNDCEVVEYYTNYNLDNYYVTSSSNYFIITRGFSSDHVLFYTEVIYLSPIEKPYMFYAEVHTKDNGIVKHYRKIYSTGHRSKEAFPSFKECINFTPDLISK